MRPLALCSLARPPGINEHPLHTPDRRPRRGLEPICRSSNVRNGSKADIQADEDDSLFTALTAVGKPRRSLVTLRTRGVCGTAAQFSVEERTVKHSLLILSLLYASTSDPKTVAPPDEVTSTKQVPGDDFDGYVNGAWRAKTEIPADRSSTGVGYDVFKVAEMRTAELIAGAAKSNAGLGSNTRRIADYYAAFLDTNGIEKRGLAPLRTQLDAIAALKDRHALSAMLGASMRADTDPLNSTSLWTENLFGLFVTQDLSRPKVTVPYLMQGGLGLPDRDYYLSAKPEMVSVRTAYLGYVTKLLGLAGMSEPATRAAKNRSV